MAMLVAAWQRAGGNREDTWMADDEVAEVFDEVIAETLAANAGPAHAGIDEASAPALPRVLAAPDHRQPCLPMLPQIVPSTKRAMW